MISRCARMLPAVVMGLIAAFAAILAISALASGSIDGPQRGADPVLRSTDPGLYWLLIFVYLGFAAGFAYAAMRFCSARPER